MPISDHSWQIALSGRDINSRILGGSSLTYSVDPSLQSSGSTSLTIRATLSGDCTRFLYAVGRGAAAPTKSTIEASGQSFGALEGAVDDAQYTGLAASNDYDIYEFSRNAGGQETPVKGPVLGSTSEAFSWQLADGHWISSQWAPIIIAPRPTEMGTGSAYLWAYPDLVYRRRIEVTGGTFPLHFEFLQNPSGATIGSDLELSNGTLVAGSNYGVIQWTAPSSGAETFQIKVTDQEGRSATASWTVTVDATKFVFYNSNAGGTNAGTLANPFNTWAACFGSTATETINAGKIVYFRSGTHTVGTHSDLTTPVMQLSSNRKPLGWLAYPGEIPTLDMTESQVNISGQSDVYVQGLKFEGSNSDVGFANPRTFLIQNTCHRGCWFENVFSNYRNQHYTQNNNQATLWFTGATRQYMAISANIWTGTCGVGLITYQWTLSALKFNKLQNANVNQYQVSNTGFWDFKDGGTQGSGTPLDGYVTCLGNEAWDNVTNGMAADISMGQQDGAALYEIVYNRVRKGIKEAHENYDNRYNMLYARNSTKLWQKGVGPQNTSTPIVSRIRNVADGGEIPTTFGTNTGNIETTGALDNTTLLLTGASRTSFLGTHGAEIA